ncbi:MAG: rod shape-determining protein, partial [Acutalibacteraceae bacterium]|nr:rod shape-determining protein [Acutalibacteraceae bacterium]
MAVDIAIDLGTSRTRIFLPRRGITADVPSVVAVGEEHEELLHFGEAAYRMIGRTPPPIRTICPLGNGVIAHFDWAAAMLAALLKETVSAKIRMPRVAVCVPVGLTDVEKRAVIDAVRRSGVRQ